MLDSIPEWLVLLLVVLLVTYTWRHHHDPLSRIPGPPSFPVIGNTFEMTQVESVDIFLKWCRDYGKVLKYKVFLLGMQILVVDADAIKHIFVNNNGNYKKPESLLIPVRKIFGSNCVICLPSKLHALRRKLLNPVFTASAVQDKCFSIHQSTLRLVSLWTNKLSQSPVLPVHEDLMRLSIDILGDCIFGYNFNYVDSSDNALIAALHRLMSVQDVNLLRFVPFSSLLPTRLNRDLRLIKDFVKEIIASKESLNKGESSHDMLDLMLQSRNVSSGAMTDSDIIDDIILFLIAGHETVTNTLCWVLYELARHPEIQQRCRDEVNEFSSSHSAITYDSICRMQYLECCIKETLRMYPPVPLTLRQAIADDNLGGYHVPAGSVIAVQVAATMRQEDYFKMASTFNPSRFITDNVQPHHFIPFLAGPDMCIGSRFAMLEMKVIMASILRNIEVRFVAGTENLFKGSQGLTYHIKPSLFLSGGVVLSD